MQQLNIYSHLYIDLHHFFVQRKTFNLFDTHKVEHWETRLKVEWLV